MTPREKERIDKEVDLLQGLDHENIVRFHATWKDRLSGRRIFITELMISGTLKKCVLSCWAVDASVQL